MGSNKTEKTMISCYASDPTGVLFPNPCTPTSWPEDMVINNCKPCKADNYKHYGCTKGEHAQGDFNAAVTLDTSTPGGSGSYCSIM